MASVQDAIQAARDEPTHAHEGPTFHRLKSAHPEASDANIQDAIKAAVKLEADCARYFSHSSPDHESNVDNAVRLARIDNPGFSDVIYKSLFDYMAFVMK
jgi:sugar phosphate isomerase/epimerase